MLKSNIIEIVLTFFIRSAEKGSFNGLPASKILKFSSISADIFRELEELVRDRHISCTFASVHMNPHIKRLPDLQTDTQIEILHKEGLDGVCLYPSSELVRGRADLSQWNDQPFSRALALVEPQLAFRAFDMAVLERYTSDPRYVVRFNDYMGDMSVTDDYFRSPGFLVD
jgi:hypothetical protein